LVARCVTAKLSRFDYKGKPAIQWVGKTAVVLTRQAQPFTKDRAERKTLRKSGGPLPTRLIVSRILRDDGSLLAEWYLLSNLEPGSQANAWRFGITGAGVSSPTSNCLRGHQQENWQQESGEAVFKRLLIASQACAVSWRLMRAKGEFAEQTRGFLVDR
jgi:hypothetical protein